LENDNFTNKSIKAKKNVRLCMAGNKKQYANIKKTIGQNKSLPCLHWNIQFPWGKT
jgi:hypothetical protein